MRKLKVVKVAPDSYQADLRGWMCPYPKYALETLLGKLPPGARLDLLVDCPAATGDIPRVAPRYGYRVTRVVPVGSGEWCLTVSSGA